MIGSQFVFLRLLGFADFFDMEEGELRLPGTLKTIK
jgi:hypothetical protein